MGVVRVT